MIKANELRLGNWAHFTGGHYKQATDFEMLEFFSRNGSPIPLTPEILEKAGFELINGVYWTKFRISLEQIENDPKYFDVTKSYGEVSLDISVQYLHELQNLYFALTGQELEINL